MFVDAVLANLLLFAVGQAFACLYLRSGRFWVGLFSTLCLWISLDGWLMARYLFATPTQDQQWPLLVLQVTAVLTTIAYLWARLRKRRGAAKRHQRYGRGLALLLAGKLDDAQAAFRELAWADPWDASAWIAWGDVFRRLAGSGSASPESRSADVAVVRKARRCYRRAASVDVGKQYADLLVHRFKLLRGVKGAGKGAVKKGSAKVVGIVPAGGKSAAHNKKAAGRAKTGS